MPLAETEGRDLLLESKRDSDVDLTNPRGSRDGIFGNRRQDLPRVATTGAVLAFAWGCIAVGVTTIVTLIVS